MVDRLRHSIEGDEIVHEPKTQRVLVGSGAQHLIHQEDQPDAVSVVRAAVDRLRELLHCFHVIGDEAQILCVIGLRGIELLLLHGAIGALEQALGVLPKLIAVPIMNDNGDQRKANDKNEQQANVEFASHR